MAALSHHIQDIKDIKRSRGRKFLTFARIGNTIAKKAEFYKILVKRAVKKLENNLKKKQSENFTLTPKSTRHYNRIKTMNKINEAADKVSIVLQVITKFLDRFF